MFYQFYPFISFHILRLTEAPYVCWKRSLLGAAVAISTKRQKLSCGHNQIQMCPEMLEIDRWKSCFVPVWSCVYYFEAKIDFLVFFLHDLSSWLELRIVKTAQGRFNPPASKQASHGSEVSAGNSQAWTRFELSFEGFPTVNLYGWNKVTVVVARFEVRVESIIQIRIIWISKV